MIPILNASDLLKKVRRYEREIKNTPVKRPDIRIAVLGSYSIQYYVKTLRYELHQRGIEAAMYEGEYNGIEMDVLDDNSAFYKFQPDVVILLPYYRDIRRFPGMFETREKVSEMVRNQLDYYQKIWERIHGKLQCQILQSNIVIPPIRQLGNLENRYCFSKTRFYNEINTGLSDTEKSYVTVLDYEALAVNFGKKKWFDESEYYLTKMGFHLDCLPQVISFTASVVCSLKGKVRKCLVLDLDNTLWGGVVGDEGWEGIQLDPNHAVGEAYRDFQQYVLSLKERGVILAVCSKNEENAAREPFEKNEHMILKLSDIACFVANWEDKASNLRRIAAELNIGTDSLVFFDDNPAEREIVKKYIPEAQVIEVPPDPADYVSAMEDAFPFEWPQLTKEDISRNNSYLENGKREALLTSFVDYDEYLKALDMRGRAALLEGADVARFSQLINKSNQFNLRTQRYTEGEILGFMRDESYRCLSVKLKDTFSEYGIISCVVLKIVDKECFIDTWVMSCRVLKRGVERMMFKKILETAEQAGCTHIKAEYIRTNKNAMVSDFYDRLGFRKESEMDGSIEYILDDFKIENSFYIAEE